MASRETSKNATHTDRDSITERIQQHLVSNASESPVVRQDFQLYERRNMHLAIEELVHNNGHQAPLGIVERDYEARLAHLVSSASIKGYSQGPVEYVDVELGPNEQIACIKQGIYLFKSDPE